MPHPFLARLALLLSLVWLAACASVPDAAGEQVRWRAHAAAVTITRDDWGIAHVRGATDADAVFGMIYAQAEDDFPRIELNYLNALGRAAEAEGESAIWRDLRQRLFIDPADLQTRYAASPAWLKRLMQAWADGLNFYLATHPQVRPRVLTRFEPWMALSFSEGSIGGDIERVSLARLEAFYGARSPADPAGPAREPGGSNGIAIGPRHAGAGRTLLLINPHTSFYFRSELQMTSDEGLNAYGAVTWGQFFVYQGFNQRLGWMHTTSGVDNVDEFLETIVDREGRLFYRFGDEERPVEMRTIVIPYRTADGGRAERRFETYRTHHGPLVRSEGERWVSVALMHRPVEALSQSFLRTRARSLREYLGTAALQGNSSNNTVYADADGHIALLIPQFMPRREDRFDWFRPVDGADPATDWGDLHALTELPQLVDPPSGWLQNANNAPWSAAGPASLSAAAFPRYFDTVGENARGLHALELLQARPPRTLEELRQLAYSNRLTAFDYLLPPLFAAFDGLGSDDARRAALAEPVALLRGWDRRWSVASEPTTLAIFWGEEFRRLIPAEVTRQRWMIAHEQMQALSADRQLGALQAALARLQREFGRWRVPWGEVNRFQRLTGAIEQTYSDDAPSLPVGFTAGGWGSLASLAASPRRGTRRWYGNSGNSFVAIVEFVNGGRVRAMAVTAGGASGDPGSPHFNDQAARYASGALREVYFWPDQLAGHTERTYRPGE